ncbi:DNA polymerase III subunit alpha [Caenispirillum salinarum]|uniref:DNA polymerase III subunit alpha n=1 Tax=Caenispirillum salinarum TaxID=859058 RepID=UPI00384C8AE3
MTDTAAASSSFVHLRVHTAYSMSEGAIAVKTLPKLCKKMGMPAVAITDTRNVFGGLEFSVGCTGEGIQPIIGCQISLRRKPEKPSGFGAREARTPEPDQLVLIAQNEAGYENLLKVVSMSYLETDGHETPQVDMAALKEHGEGLICLTGGPLGPVGRLILDGQMDAAEDMLKALADIYTGRLYVEIQRHGMPREDQSEPGFIDLAYKLDLPLVATNECFFPDRDMYEAHDALICMAEKSFLSHTDRRRLTPEHYFKSPEEMRDLFKDLPEAIENTLVIAKRCAVMVEKRDPILPRAPQAGGRSEEEALREVAAEGLRARLDVHVYTDGMSEEDKEAAAKPYWDRLEYELGIINKMGFPGYFMIVADFIQWGKDHDIPVGPGRGSGAGSLVAWALTITDLDPLRFALLFERFLNPERVSMPDFDVDFCQDRREEVIRYVQEKYGRDKVAQIITFGKLQARAVVRSVGRVLEMPLGYVDKICKMIPNNPANPCTLPEALEQEPQLAELRDSDPQVAHMLSIALKLEGLFSHASTHAAGVVIGDRPLDELVPLYRDPNSDMPVTQFNMKWVEQAGLVKFDFLGLKTLTVINTAVKHIKEQHGVDIDMSALPLDDEKSYRLLARGETAGVFQLESTGMRDVLTKLKPDCLEDIIAVVALYRPGPMDNIPSYIRRKQGEEEVIYMHPDLEQILSETYGIMIYQEQVMQAAQILAGYSLGGADLLRRAMGKKIQAEMDKQRTMFCDGAEQNNIPREKASEIFDTIAKFAGYGFNKSHAAAYALVAYQTAYLKANYPVEFMAATMTYDMHNTEKLEAFKAELGRLKIDLLPPDINKSEVLFSVEKGAVRYALSAIKNVGQHAMETLVNERRKNGPFKDIKDFAQRLDTKAVNKRLLENLVRAGAFDCLNKNRAQTFAAIETIMRHAQAAAQERSSSQVSLFGGTQEATPPLTLPKVPDWTPVEKLDCELAAIGFYLSAHPLDTFDRTLKRLSVVKSSELVEHLKNGGANPVKMAGSVGGRKERVGKNGSRYAFVTLSDAGGTYEVMFFSEILAASREILESGKPVVITVDARLDGEQVRLGAKAVENLEEVAARSTKKLEIHIDNPEPLERLRAVIDKDKPGNGTIVVVAHLDEYNVELKYSDRQFQLSAATLSALRNTPGVMDVVEI